MTKFSWMLQRLLIERFAIKYHWEERETAVFALLVAKDGPKLEKASDPTAMPRTVMTPFRLEIYNRSLDDLASVLTLLSIALWSR